ncbi:Pkinase-domain-containing protein [Trichodelitschia bisporula]|uniref:mitogen-activated protein kinase n=1 Tax=Trichodelitschia bisporula TaxID=703511 RepID=A0A6G1HW55_9PEZI|nr:Pkinase-domain-containing protein [Trichodelitschia bisporula]
MALLTRKLPYNGPTSQYTPNISSYRVQPPSQHHGFFASPTESEFSENFDTPNVVRRNWDEGMVAEWLRSINCSQYVDLFVVNNINGKTLVELDRSHLRDMGIKKLGDQIRIAAQVKKFRLSESKRVSKSVSNRESLAMLDGPAFTPPSSASPKPGPAARGATSSRADKRLSRQITDLPSIASLGAPGPKQNSRPSSPYIEQDSRGGHAQRYDAASPQRSQTSISSAGPSSGRIPDHALASRYAMPPRAATTPASETPQSGRFGHVRASPSMDGSVTNASMLPADKALIRVIYDNGRSSVVSIEGCKTVEEVMLKTLKKGNLNEAHVKNYCFYILDGLEPNPAHSHRINEAETWRICSDRMRVERNRLILRKIHTGEPDDEQLKTAASIAAQIELQKNQNVILPLSTRSQLKIEKITGESLAPVSYPLSPASLKERERQVFTATQAQVVRAHDAMGSTRAPLRRIKEHFGGRPPSELIASDLSTYFPDFEKDEIERTVRMSIRRSRRISRATSRLSTVSNFSMASSLKDAPPLPAISDAWLQNAGQVPKTARPLSVQRLGSGNPSYRDSMASSVLESVDEENPLEPDRKSYVSFAGSDGIAITDPEGNTTMHSYYDDGRSSVANSSLSGEGSDSLHKHLSQVIQEDSEESDEELSEYLEADSWDNVKYMKGALIGQGSFGSVYIALLAVTGELIAVKQVEMPSDTGTPLDAKKKNMVEALKHEIGLLRDLKHPNIVQYLGSNSDDTHLNIFLEYIPGGSVAAMLVNYGPLGESLIANFVRQILTGLAYLHSRDIIHRDIKGANILVDNKGMVKISDFGISKRVEASTLLNSASGGPVGTGKPSRGGNRVSLQGSVFWMAPEVVRQTAYTRKADIWSLGCLIVEMLTGQHPHPNCTQMQAIFKIGSALSSSGDVSDASPQLPESASEELKSFCRRTFRTDHERRPTADELLRSEFVTGGAKMS